MGQSARTGQSDGLEPRSDHLDTSHPEIMDAVKNTLFPGAGGTDSAAADGVPWWMKYVAKALAILSAVAAMFYGALAAISVSPMCMIAGIWQIAAGFIIIVVEAPFCCMFLDFVQSYAELVEKRPPWQKALLYVVLSLPPFFLCLGLSTLIGSGAICATGVFYGMQMVGKKASPADMAAAARGNEPDEKNIMDGGDDWQSHP